MADLPIRLLAAVSLSPSLASVGHRGSPFTNFEPAANDIIPLSFHVGSLVVKSDLPGDLLGVLKRLKSKWDLL